MGLRLGRLGMGPEVGPGVIRFGWDYQTEHERGFEAHVTLEGAAWSEVRGMRVLIANHLWLDGDVERVWDREGCSDARRGGSPVWVLWSQEGPLLFFTDHALAAEVEAALAAGTAALSYEERIRGEVRVDKRGPRGGEGVLRWTPA